MPSALTGFLNTISKTSTQDNERIQALVVGKEADPKLIYLSFLSAVKSLNEGTHRDSPELLVGSVVVNTIKKQNSSILLFFPSSRSQSDPFVSTRDKRKETCQD